MNLIFFGLLLICFLSLQVSVCQSKCQRRKHSSLNQRQNTFTGLPDDCGKGLSQPRRRSSNRIIHGEEAAHGRYPSLFIFRYGSLFHEWCPAVLISSRHLITTAECIIMAKKKEEEPKYVFYNDTEMNYNVDPLKIIHPVQMLCHMGNYDKEDETGKYNNYGLIKLEHEIDYRATGTGKGPWPACLPDTELEDGEILDISGWGASGFDEEIFFMFPYSQHLEVRYTKKEDEKELSLSSSDDNLTRSVCWNDEADGVYKTVNGKQTIFGLVSNIPEHCEGAFGATNLYHFKKNILDMMENDCSAETTTKSKNRYYIKVPIKERKKGFWELLIIYIFG